MDESGYVKYRSDLGEISAKLAIERLSRLELKKVPEAKEQKTPDYELLDSSGTMVAICEVKSLVDRFASSTPSFEEIGAEAWRDLMRKIDANHRSKIRKKLAEAMKQLPKDSQIPTAVIFVSFDMSDWIDMAQVLQEHTELFPDDSLPDWCAMVKVHQGVVPSNSFQIKDTIQLMHNTERGKEFGAKYLETEDTLKRAGVLPLDFTL